MKSLVSKIRLASLVLSVTLVGSAMSEPSQTVSLQPPQACANPKYCPELDRARLTVTINELDAWAATASIRIEVLKDLEELDIALMSSGNLELEGTAPGMSKIPLPFEIYPGFPARGGCQGKLTGLKAKTDYFYGIPLSITPGIGHLVVSLAERANGALVASAASNQVVISDGRDLHIGTSATELRSQILRDRLEKEQRSDAEIERRIQSLKRGGAVSSGRVIRH